MIRLASFLWLWFQSVCPLMPSCNTSCLTWVSHTLDVGYLFTAISAKCSRRSWPWTWDSSSWPLCIMTNILNLFHWTSIGFRFSFSFSDTKHFASNSWAFGSSCYNQFLTVSFPGKREDCFCKIDLLILCYYKHIELTVRSNSQHQRDSTAFSQLPWNMWNVHNSPFT